jgi:hypothetical protein
MGVDYTQEKLWQATHILIGTGSIQERLSSANLYLVRLTMGKEAAFPDRPDLDERLESVLSQISAAAPKLNDEDAEKVATEILSLYTEASRAARYAVGAPSID